jgi:predicted unusual protein kinase regulating ubiquinone biosynthesis (AarF/ABC1/UbiB family)
MARDKERVPGRLERTLKTAWLGGRVGTSYLAGKVTDALRREPSREGAQGQRHLENAGRIVRTMGELRGPLMKIGQLLSTHAEALPPEYGSILRSLQSSAPPMSFATIRTVLEEELGAPPESIFEDFSHDAVAAASLGQVHEARLPDGTRVAVKVQYPGADASVRADLANVDLASGFVKRALVDLLGQSRFDLTPIAEELTQHLVQETDYCREAYNAKLLGRLFEGDAEIVVPRVHDACSGLRVITYDWLEGEPLDAGLTHAQLARRERTVRQLHHAFWHQFFRGGLLHADPHPGNFKCMPDGRLGLLDYGCVKVFEEPFMRAFGEMMHASLVEDEERLRDVFVDLGLMEDRESDDELEDMQRLARYFSVGVRDDEVFDFRDFDYVDAGRALVAHFLGRRRPPPAQRHFLFLTRVVLGYYEYFSRADARMNFHRMVMPYVREGFTGRVIELPPYDG